MNADKHWLDAASNAVAEGFVSESEIIDFLIRCAPMDTVAVLAERKACAELCRRPEGWLNKDQQKIADEIRNSILNRSISN